MGFYSISAQPLNGLSSKFDMVQLHTCARLHIHEASSDRPTNCEVHISFKSSQSKHFACSIMIQVLKTLHVIRRDFRYKPELGAIRTLAKSYLGAQRLLVSERLLCF